MTIFGSPRYDKDYEAKIAAAIITAIFEASIVRPEGQDKGGTAYMRTGEIVSACISVIAYQAATSRATDTPRNTRELIEAIGKRLKRRIAYTRDEFAAGRGGPATVIHEEDFQ